ARQFQATRFPATQRMPSAPPLVTRQHPSSRPALRLSLGPPCAACSQGRPLRLPFRARLSPRRPQSLYAGRVSAGPVGLLRPQVQPVARPLRQPPALPPLRASPLQAQPPLALRLPGWAPPPRQASR